MTRSSPCGRLSWPPAAWCPAAHTGPRGPSSGRPSPRRARGAPRCPVRPAGGPEARRTASAKWKGESDHRRRPGQLLVRVLVEVGEQEGWFPGVLGTQGCSVGPRRPALGSHDAQAASGEEEAWPLGSTAVAMETCPCGRLASLAPWNPPSANTLETQQPRSQTLWKSLWLSRDGSEGSAHGGPGARPQGTPSGGRGGPWPQRRCWDHSSEARLVPGRKGRLWQKQLGQLRLEAAGEHQQKGPRAPRPGG